MENIVGILICNTQKVLDHKLRDGKQSESNYCYWEMPRFPRRILDVVFPESLGAVSESVESPATLTFDEDDYYFPEGLEVRLYFAVKGQVLGYFVPRALGERHGIYELRFFSESWKAIKPIQIKPSQGFRYFNHETCKGGC